MDLDKSLSVFADFKVGRVELLISHSRPSGIGAEAFCIADNIFPSALSALIAEDIVEVETRGSILGSWSVIHRERDVLGGIFVPIRESECQVSITVASVRAGYLG